MLIYSIDYIPHKKILQGKNELFILVFDMKIASKSYNSSL